MHALGNYYGLGKVGKLKEPLPSVSTLPTSMSCGKYGYMSEEECKTRLREEAQETQQRSDELMARAGSAASSTLLTAYQSYKNAQAQVDIAKQQGKSAAEVARIQADASIKMKQMELEAQKMGIDVNASKGKSWVIPVAIGGGALFLLMMMGMVMMKRNPKIL